MTNETAKTNSHYAPLAILEVLAEIRRSGVLRTFSQRKGIVSVRTELQSDDMDIALKNGLWNALMTHYWKMVGGNPVVESDSMPSNMRLLIKSIWANLLKQSLDTIPYRWSDVYETLRGYFFDSPWYIAYDFIEFVANAYRIPVFNQKFIAECNSTLERELSAYRFVDAKIVQIISKEEIAEIEEALGAHETLGPVAGHLKRALDLLADRKSPDYRNSIKESISSVEALSRRITSNDNATLADALNLIEKEGKITLHPALRKSFSSLSLL